MQLALVHSCTRASLGPASRAFKTISMGLHDCALILRKAAGMQSAAVRASHTQIPNT